MKSRKAGWIGFLLVLPTISTSAQVLCHSIPTSSTDSPTVVPNASASASAGYAESQLPESVKKVLKKIRRKVGEHENAWYWEHMGVARAQAGSLVRALGPIARSERFIVFGFYEKTPPAFSRDGETHLVLYDTANSKAREVFHPLGHITFMGFKPPDRLAWFEDFGDMTKPFLAIQEQYHNGTWNVLGTHYMTISENLSLAQAFEIAEKRKDSVAEQCKDCNGVCFESLEASVYGEPTKDGKPRIGWKVEAGCPSRRFKISSGHLELASGGHYRVSDSKLFRAEYKGLMNPFDVEYPHY